jgi:membrane-associated phospholipid phosphatase
MAITVRPTKPDIEIARAIARNISPMPEQVGELVTWGADEHVLIAASVAWWLWTRKRPAAQQRAGDHVLVTTIAAAVMPHILKRLFNQTRPDRKTVQGHLHGVPLSGNAYDAFPSGHAMHIGALASAASQLPPAQRNAAWGAGAVLASTRILLLAHWTSDVLVGLALGALLERGLRFATGFSQSEARQASRQRRTKFLKVAGNGKTRTTIR